MSDFEFSEAQHRTLQGFALKVTIFAVIIVVLAGLRIVLTMIEGGEAVFALDTILVIILAFATLFYAVVLMRPMHHFRHIHNHEGDDIDELMGAVEHLTEGLDLLKWVVTGTILLNIISGFVRFVF